VAQIPKRGGVACQREVLIHPVSHVVIDGLDVLSVLLDHALKGTELLLGLHIWLYDPEVVERRVAATPRE